MYSSNSSVILLLVTFLLFSAGLAFIKTGGSVSFAPPVGIPICAQPPEKIETNGKIEIIRNSNIDEVNFIIFGCRISSKITRYFLTY